MPGMFKWVGQVATSRPWLVCAVWILAGVALSLSAPAWESKAQDDDIHFLPARCPSVRGYQLLEQAFPQDVFASKAIVAIERDHQPLTEADFALVDHCVKDLVELRQEVPGLQIGNITSYRDGFIGRRLLSADRRCTLIQISLSTPFLALKTRATVDRIEMRLRQRLASMGNESPRVLVTGPAGLGRDLLEAGAHSLEGTTLATVILVVVVLLAVYRAPILALIPLATIAVSVWVSLELLALMTLLPGVHLVNISRVFAVVILYGAGTDYCLFLISRYREELSQDPNRTLALCRSVSAVGAALAASAGTVICGLGLMGLAEFAKIRCAGPAIALSLAVALAASLTLTPALLRILGRAVFWPGAVPVAGKTQPASARSETVWDWISGWVVGRPLLVWCGAVAAVVPFVVLGLRVEPNYRSTGELQPSAQSIKGVAAIQRHFTAGEIGPLTVMLIGKADWNRTEGRNIIAHLSHGFALLPNVADVRSLTQPLGASVAIPTVSPAAHKLFGGILRSIGGGLEAKLDQAAQASRDFYTRTLDSETGSRYVTRLDVVFRSDPFDRASVTTMDTIQTWLEDELPSAVKHLGGVETEIYGVTASANDLALVTEADRCRVNLLVLSGIFLILLVVVRKPWLAAYLLVTVLFSYYATLGATVLAGKLVSGRPLDQVEWRVPFFLFTILVAVGEDYNILLITRVLQERLRLGSTEGTKRALARTGGTITSCGVIMAGTFATLMLGGLGTLMQIGFALAFGVLLDTFVVRTFLVPAFALLVWRLQGFRAPPEAPRRALPVPERLAG
jgi:RND superfamily putative drug exporter